MLAFGSREGTRLLYALPSATSEFIGGSSWGSDGLSDRLPSRLHPQTGSHCESGGQNPPPKAGRVRSLRRPGASSLVTRDGIPR